MPNSERAEIALLIARGVEIRGRHRMRMTLSWKGPKAGRRHDPRIYRWVGITARGQKWRVLGVHLPFGAKQQAESTRRVSAWLRNHRMPSIAAGDWNRRKDRTARAVGEKVAGSGIDLAAYRGCRLVEVARLGHHGSDHPAMLYRFEAKRRGKRHHLSVVAWNVERGHKAADVRAAIRKFGEHHPDVIVLTETYLLHGDLGGLGYQVVQLAPKPKGAKR